MYAFIINIMIIKTRKKIKNNSITTMVSKNYFTYRPTEGQFIFLFYTAMDQIKLPYL